MASLVRLGQSPDADLLYRTLVNFGPRTAAALAADLGMALARVGRALDELTSAGAVAPEAAAPSRAPTWTPRPAAEVAHGRRPEVAHGRRVDVAAGRGAGVAFGRRAHVGVPLVAALIGLLERHLRPAREPTPTTGAAPLQPRERALIALLAAGYTDARAARELGISRRTVSNILRDLLDRLGVTNRFQLGLTLGARYAIRPRHHDAARRG